MYRIIIVFSTLLIATYPLEDFDIYVLSRDRGLQPVFQENSVSPFQASSIIDQQSPLLYFESMQIRNDVSSSNCVKIIKIEVKRYT